MCKQVNFSVLAMLDSYLEFPKKVYMFFLTIFIASCSQQTCLSVCFVLGGSWRSCPQMKWGGAQNLLRVPILGTACSQRFRNGKNITTTTSPSNLHLFWLLWFPLLRHSNIPWRTCMWTHKWTHVVMIPDILVINPWCIQYIHTHLIILIDIYAKPDVTHMKIIWKYLSTPPSLPKSKSHPGHHIPGVCRSGPDHLGDGVATLQLHTQGVHRVGRWFDLLEVMVNWWKKRMWFISPWFRRFSCVFFNCDP